MPAEALGARAPCCVTGWAGGDVTLTAWVHIDSAASVRTAVHLDTSSGGNLGTQLNAGAVDVLGDVPVAGVASYSAAEV